MARKYMDSCFAWIIASMSFLNGYAVASNVVALGVILPDLLAHFQTSQAMLGMLGSIKFAIADLTSGEITTSF
jgi:uncharacterized membrane protein